MQPTGALTAGPAAPTAIDEDFEHLAHAGLRAPVEPTRGRRARDVNQPRSGREDKRRSPTSSKLLLTPGNRECAFRGELGVRTEGGRGPFRYALVALRSSKIAGISLAAKATRSISVVLAVQLGLSASP